MRKIHSFFALAAVTATAVLAGSCLKTDNYDSTDLAFHVVIESVGVNEVTAHVRHNGTEDASYYVFCYRDFNYGETLAVEREVDALSQEGTDVASRLHVGSDARVTCTGLQSSTMYRIVVVGMDSDCNVYGTPSSAYFTTGEGSVIYESNPDWTVLYQGKQASTDNAGYGDVLQVTTYTADNGYFVFAVPLIDYQQKGIQQCIEEAVAEQEATFREWEEEGYLVNRGDYVHYTTAAYIVDTESGMENVGIAAGVDENYRPTGLYAVSRPFVPDAVEYSTAYGRWLGTWTLSGYYEDENGTDQYISYDVTIDYLVPDQSYRIEGYQEFTGVDLPDVQTTFDSASGNMLFTAAYAGYYGGYDVYFYATRTSGNNMNYLQSTSGSVIAIADINSTWTSATVSANAALTQSGGTPFNATEMQFMGFSGTSATAYSQVPQFPFVMTKK